MKQLVLSCLESRVENNKSLYARFVLSPLQKGSALTIGTALRRVLLSQIEGIAITALDIQGITHEFCTIPGIRESVLELSLNFQQIVLQSQKPLRNSQVGYLQIQGPATVCANDLQLPLGVKCVDPTQHIATLSRDGFLVVKFLVGRGMNNAELQANNRLLTYANIQEAKKRMLYQSDSAETQSSDALPKATQSQASLSNLKSKSCFQHVIPLHSFCVPVNRANFTVQVDELSNQERERLFLEVWTNGSIHPRQAMQSAVLSLLDLFSKLKTLIHLDSQSVGLRDVSADFPYARQSLDGILLSSPLKESSLTPTEQTIKKPFSYLYAKESDNSSLLSSDISNLSLSLKTYTLLKYKGIHKLETLLTYSQKEMLEMVCGSTAMFYEIKRCISILGFEVFA